MQVSSSVRAVQVPESNPMHPQFTTIYLVGRGQVLTIDSGADEERYRWMLRGYLAATEKAEIAQCAVTHFHFDHSANIRWMCEEFEAEALMAPETAARLDERELTPKRTKLIADGAVLRTNGARLQAIHTPGHSPESFCYYLEEEGILFSGDTILGGTTTAVQDLGAYMHSLSILRALPNLGVICPGHGPIIDNAVETIDGYIRHREDRERQVVGALSSGEALTSWQIMERLYPDIDPRLRRLADGNVRSHLAKLTAERRVTEHVGTPRVPSESERAEVEAEERTRTETIRQAEEYREQARRRALFLQEYPPTQDWLEPPRFELV
jgi:ribonuclease/clavin/mitogillin